MYECTICLTSNHSSRYHCQVCGTVPAKYSILGIPFIVKDDMVPINIVAAIGCERTGQYKTARIQLKTVTLDYYGE